VSERAGGEASVRAAVPPAARAVVFGSGLAVVPLGLAVTGEMDYEALGWPVGAVPGHAGRLAVAGDALLAYGRGHSYEGFSEARLEAPVHDLATAGVRRLVVTCACGSLTEELMPGEVLVAHAVVDLRFAPDRQPPRLAVCSPAAAQRTAAALAPDLRARPGIYVAVAGPQYETPAEAAWLACFGDAVGMSAAPEVRAAAAAGVAVRLLAVVTNRAGTSLGHDEVLAASERARHGLRRALARLLDPHELWPR
jgi:purine nucleoside phosphorylase